MPVTLAASGQERSPGSCGRQPRSSVRDHPGGPEISLEILIFPARRDIGRAVGTLFVGFTAGANDASERDIAQTQDHI